MYCPLMSFAKQYSNEQQCLGEECAFAADKGGNCLVKQALQCYVNSAKEKTEFVRTYMGKPYQFLEPGDTTPVKLRHGGVYDDMTPYYDNDPLRPRTIIPASNEDDEWHPGVSSKDPLY